MSLEIERWADYFIPDTYDADTRRGTLRNRFDERDADVLDILEYGETTRRQRELMSGDVQIPRTYDAAHVRAIHHHLFQDVYDWAGDYRTVTMAKGTPGGFADAQNGEIDRYLTDVHGIVTATPWSELEHGDFAERAANVFAYLNQAHPFREGNGRTSKVFLDQVADLSRFTLDYDRVSAAEWNEASKWSAPDMFEYKPHPHELVPVFRRMAVEREPEPAPEAPPAPAGRDRRAQRDLSAIRAALGHSQAQTPRPATAEPVRYENPTAREAARSAGDRER